MLKIVLMGMERTKQSYGYGEKTKTEYLVENRPEKGSELKESY